MKHPSSRGERRHNGETYRNRWRYIMVNIWYTPNRYENPEEYWVENRTWWARKQSFGHGNRCMCHFEKRTEKRKRRVALNNQIALNLRSWQE